MKRLLLGLALLAAFGCGNHSDNDQLSKGHKNLSARVVPCGADTAVNGVAGVNDPSDLVYLDDWVILSVCHLDTLQAEAEKAQKPISLYIEGLDAGVPPSGISLQQEEFLSELTRQRTPEDVASV